MSKRLVLKLGVMVATLSAVTLLQGCGDNDGVVVAGAWMPVGGGSLSGFVFGTATGVGGNMGGGGGQGTTGATAGAVAAGAGGGGGQVSTGVAF
jgi:hypothetical protein